MSTPAMTPRSTGSMSTRLLLGALLLVFVACLLAPATARAHELGLSRGRYVAEGQGVSVAIAFARRDAIALSPGVDPDRDGALTEAEVAAGGASLASRVLSKLEISADDAPCEVKPTGARLVEEDGIEVDGTAACKATLGSSKIDVALPLLDELATGHRHLAVLTREGEVREAMLHRREPRLTAASRPGGEKGAAITSASEDPAPAVLSFVWIGVEHILFGWDHVVFLVGLVLVAGFGQHRARSIFLAVTAFTVAHSITLALAVLGIVVPSGEVIEPLIALSVAYVGVENFLVKDPSKRWRVTLPFGLIHGFGFAGALGEVGLPKGQVPAALALFNVGVELGQLAILAVLLPIVFALAKRPAYARWGVRAASFGIVMAGLFWFAERVTG